MIDRTTNVPSNWDDEFDVVIAGAGSAGLACAVVAAVEGLSVLVLEKGDLVGGTTAMSGGGAWFPANRHTSEVGVQDSPEEALEMAARVGPFVGENAVDMRIARRSVAAWRHLPSRLRANLSVIPSAAQ